MFTLCLYLDSTWHTSKPFEFWTTIPIVLNFGTVILHALGHLHLEYSFSFGGSIQSNIESAILLVPHKSVRIECASSISDFSTYDNLNVLIFGEVSLIVVGSLPSKFQVIRPKRLATVRWGFEPYQGADSVYNLSTCVIDCSAHSAARGSMSRKNQKLLGIVHLRHMSEICIQNSTKSSGYMYFWQD